MLLLIALACIATDDSNDTSDTTDTVTDTESAGPAQVELVTTLGTVVLELDAEAAPVTAANFLQYVDDGFYDGDDGLGATTFHRVIPGFMAQGGGRTTSTNKDTRDPIVNESDNGLSNLRGTIAMARTDDPDSATSQFFINVVDNTQLDIDGLYPPGYAVFGSVISGMDVVDEIVAVPRNGNDVPETPIEITDAERL
jgi:cyclophilin family peptidyl-prolyl cis-trans isomerase